jgi:transposase
MSEVSYLGIDVHKKKCVFVEIDSTGKILRRGSFGNTFMEVSDFASSLSPRIHLVLEPVLDYLWLLDQLEPFVGSVHVAVPFKVRIIAESKCKTDRYDARMLAELLRVNFLPESWIPSREIRCLRGLVRQRYFLVKQQTMNKNRIRHLLFSQAVTLKISDVTSPSARRRIAKMSLPTVARQAIVSCLEIAATLEMQITALDDHIKDQVMENETVSLLKTIPGVGPVRSAVIYGEIGDITRFNGPKALASYSGLTPSIRASGDSIHQGGITHIGSGPLRHALVEAAIDVIKKSPSLKRMHTRILFRSNKQTARVAVARKLAVIIYRMLSRREAFRRNVA